MSKFSKRGRIKKIRLKEENKERQREKQRLKSLPKVLRKLETDLGFYVDFIDVYDGYISDFTGEIVPMEAVDNPFAILSEMELNFPHQNSLSSEEKLFYIEKISDAFNRMGFYFYSDTPEMYELLLFYIENPTDETFSDFCSIQYKNMSLTINRTNSDSFY